MMLQEKRFIPFFFDVLLSLMIWNDIIHITYK